VFLGRGTQHAVNVQPCIVCDDLGLLHEAARATSASAPFQSTVADDRTGALVRIAARASASFPAYAVLPSARHVPRACRVLVISKERLRSGRTSGLLSSTFGAAGAESNRGG
jgi:hypothetical protein